MADSADVVLDLVVRVKDQTRTALSRIGSQGARAGNRISGAFKKARASMLALGKQARLLRPSMETLFRLFTAGLGIGVAVKTAATFRKSMAEVATIVDTSTVSMEGMRDAVLELSAAHGTSEATLAAGLYQAISAGVTAGAEATEFLADANKLAVAAVAETDEAVELLTGTINAYGLGFEEASRISDVFFTTVKRGVTTIPDLSASMSKVLPIAAELGISVEQVSAAIATMTLSGASTSEAVTRLAATLTVLLNKNEDLNTVLRSTGTVIDDNTFKTKTLAEVLNDLRIATGGSQLALSNLIVEKEATLGIFGLTGTSAAKFADILDDLTDSVGATGDAFREQMADPAAKARVALFAMRVELVKMGDEILKGIVDAIEYAGGLEVVRQKFAALTTVIARSVTAAVDQFAARIRTSKVEVAELGDEADTTGRKVGQLAHKLQQAGDRAEIAIIALGIGLTGLSQGFRVLRHSVETWARIVIELTSNVATQVLNAIGLMVDGIHLYARALGDAEFRLPLGLSDAFGAGADVLEDVQGGLERLQLLHKEFSGAVQDEHDARHEEFLKTSEEVRIKLEADLERIRILRQRMAMPPGDPTVVKPGKEFGFPAPLSTTGDGAPDESQIKQLDKFALGMQEALTTLGDLSQALGAQLVGGTFNAFRGFFNDIAEGAKSATEAIKDFGRNFALMIADMFAQLAAKQLVFGLFGGTLLGNALGLQANEDGGIMHGARLGSLPIKSYSGGGIADSPQVAIYGEGKASQFGEAFVPLGGNRKIPVEMSGAGGGDTLNLTLNVGSLDPRTAAQVILGSSREIEDVVASAFQSGRNRALMTAVRNA